MEHLKTSKTLLYKDSKYNSKYKDIKRIDNKYKDIIKIKKMMVNKIERSESYFLKKYDFVVHLMMTRVTWFVASSIVGIMTRIVLTRTISKFI